MMKAITGMHILLGLELLILIAVLYLVCFDIERLDLIYGLCFASLPIFIGMVALLLLALKQQKKP